MGTTGTIVPAGVGAANAVPHAPRTVMETIQRPSARDRTVCGSTSTACAGSAPARPRRTPRTASRKSASIAASRCTSRPWAVRIRSGCRSRMVDHSHRTRGGSRLFDFPRPVWLLGWVSLATDSATEAIYPLLPFFLTRVLGAGAVSLGIRRGSRGSRQQHAEDRVRAPGGSFAHASDRSCSSATASRRSRGRSSPWPRPGRRSSSSGCSTASAKASAARRGTRCSRPGRRRRRAGRCTASIAHGPHRRRRRPGAGVAVPLVLSGSLSHALRADDHSRRDRGRADLPDS